MRGIAFSVATMLCAVGCGMAGCGTAPEDPSTPESLTTSSSVQGQFVTVDNIRRVRADMPPGYEIADVDAAAAPATVWGFGTQWTADPEQCSALADPAGMTPVQGLSASGPGGILYAVVGGTAGAPIELDPTVVASCPQWSMTSPRTTGTVTYVDPPQIGEARVLGMSSTAETVVEGGTSTSSTSRTYVAYLGGGYVAWVALVTDPGSAEQAIDPQFAATLLVKTVSALRG